jgi:hypothetical protein
MTRIVSHSRRRQESGRQGEIPLAFEVTDKSRFVTKAQPVGNDWLSSFVANGQFPQEKGMLVEEGEIPAVL